MEVKYAGDHLSGLTVVLMCDLKISWEVWWWTERQARRRPWPAAPTTLSKEQGSRARHRPARAVCSKTRGWVANCTLKLVEDGYVKRLPPTGAPSVTPCRVPLACGGDTPFPAQSRAHMGLHRAQRDHPPKHTSQQTHHTAGIRGWSFAIAPTGKAKRGVAGKGGACWLLSLSLRSTHHSTPVASGQNELRAYRSSGDDDWCVL